MKNIKTYKLFCEATENQKNSGYDEIMNNLSGDVDLKKIQQSEDEISKLKNSIDLKKVELEKQLENLEKLQVDTFTDENKKTVEDKKVQLKDTIDKVKVDISKYEEMLNNMKDNLSNLKK